MTSLSRVVSRALRHEPWLYELELDQDGWIGVDALLAALREERPSWSSLNERDLMEMMAASSKQRHEIANGRIRALYGHSLPYRPRKEPASPPAYLFHGTAPEAVGKIRELGLLPMRRQYVHLSSLHDDAIAVGRRKSPTPIVATVKAQAAWQGGVAFYAGNDKVWLADHVPPAYVDFEDGAVRNVGQPR